MKITQFAELLCGRSLTTEEMAMMNCLTPQGMSKFNTDLDRGVLVDQILSDLRAVYRAMLRRRTEVVRGLPTNLLALLAALEDVFDPSKVVFSASEMLVMRDKYRFGALRHPFKSNGRLAKGFDLDELVNDYYASLMLADLAAEPLPSNTFAVYNQLVVTQRPPLIRTAQLYQVGEASAAITNQENAEKEKLAVITSPIFRRTNVRKCSLGISPVVTWFSEKPAPPLEISDREAALQLRDKLIDQIEAGNPTATAGTPKVDPPKRSQVGARQSLTMDLNLIMATATSSENTKEFGVSSASTVSFASQQLRRQSNQQQPFPPQSPSGSPSMSLRSTSICALSTIVSDMEDMNRGMPPSPLGGGGGGAPRLSQGSQAGQLPPQPLTQSIVLDTIGSGITKSVRFGSIDNPSGANVGCEVRVIYPSSPVSRKYRSSFKFGSSPTTAGTSSPPSRCVPPHHQGSPPASPALRNSGSSSSGRHQKNLLKRLLTSCMPKQ